MTDPLSDEQRYRLRFGPYKTPRLKRGAIVHCERRGEVQVVGLTDAAIPWPTGKAGRKTTIVLCGELIRAVKLESNQAVSHWWGVSGQTVTSWRKALEVGRRTEGSAALYRDHYETRAEQMHALSAPTLSSPERRQKIADAKRGKPRPPHVIETLRRANTGRKATTEQRQRMSDAHRRRGTRPPAAGRSWSEEEEALLLTMSDRDVADRTGRTLTAVYLRRRKLGLPRIG